MGDNYVKDLFDFGTWEADEMVTAESDDSGYDKFVDIWHNYEFSPEGKPLSSFRLARVGFLSRDEDMLRIARTMASAQDMYLVLSELLPVLEADYPGRCLLLERARKIVERVSHGAEYDEAFAGGFLAGLQGLYRDSCPYTYKDDKVSYTRWVYAWRLGRNSGTAQEFENRRLLDQAYEDGYGHGCCGESSRLNHYVDGSRLREYWLKGWEDGMEVWQMANLEDTHEE